MLKRLFILALLFFSAWPLAVRAAQQVTIVYQNDLHAWVFPSSTRMGMAGMARILDPLFKQDSNSFYTMAGDLFTGPIFPDDMRGAAALAVWNRFYENLENEGFGGRVFISAGNHEFDYGVPAPQDFLSGLLCANLLDAEDHPYYTPFRIVKTATGLRVGFLGLLLEGSRRVRNAIEKEGLKTVPPLKAVNRFVPEMGPLDLTVLMIHDEIPNILRLAEQIPTGLGVDIILAGHNHVVLDSPLERNGIFIFQAGAMNQYYGVATLFVENGRVLSVGNQMKENMPSSLDRATLRLKEISDGMKGKTVAVLKNSLLGACMRGRENSLGDFVTDAFRWATGSDVAMTNSSSLRKAFRVFPGEPRTLREGDFKNMTPFQNHLVTGIVTGDQLMAILEGDVVHFVNQISGVRYAIDAEKPRGRRVAHAMIGGKPIVADKKYTLTHNAFCARPENMRKYLHLNPGSIEWKKTPLLDYDVLIDYARHLKVIDYPSEGEGRIRHLP